MGCPSIGRQASTPSLLQLSLAAEVPRKQRQGGGPEAPAAPSKERAGGGPTRRAAPVSG
jgi:hypothetical protein